MRAVCCRAELGPRPGESKVLCSPLVPWKLVPASPSSFSSTPYLGKEAAEVEATNKN